MLYEVYGESWNVTELEKVFSCVLSAYIKQFTVERTMLCKILQASYVPKVLLLFFQLLFINGIVYVIILVIDLSFCCCTCCCYCCNFFILLL